MKWVKLFAFVLYCIALTAFVNSHLESINPAFQTLLYCLYIPACSVIVLAVHEIAHFIAFRLFGMSVSELRVGLISFQFRQKRVSAKLLRTGFFCGSCVAWGLSGETPGKIVFALSAGGVSGLVVGALSFATFLFHWNTKIDSFLICLSTVALYSFYATLISKRGADHNEIRKALEGERHK